MLKTSSSSTFRCSLSLLIFASLLVTGLSSDGDDGKQAASVIEAATPTQPALLQTTTTLLQPPNVKQSNATSALVIETSEGAKVEAKDRKETDAIGSADDKSDAAEVKHDESLVKTGNDSRIEGEDASKNEENATAAETTLSLSSTTTTATPPIKTSSTEAVPVTDVAEASSDGVPEIENQNSTKSNVSEPTSTTNTSTTEHIEAAMKEQLAADSRAVRPKDMSSGVVALVMAIVFAVVVIIVYIGLLAWRRYLEYTYGNRELLVNDLEFDTNDLRHFEL